MSYLKCTRYIFAAAVSFVPAMSQAQDISILTPDAVIVPFDPFSGFPGLETIYVDLVRTDASELTASLVIEPEFGGNFSLLKEGYSAAYELEANQGDYTSSRFEMPVFIPAGETEANIEMTVRIPIGQYASAGESEQSLRMNLVDPLSGELLAPEQTFTIGASVASRVQTNFAGTSQGFEGGIDIAEVEFGELKSGDSRQVQFQIRGNSDANISMSSENNGRLINLENETISPVPYSIVADGVYSDLSVPLEFTRRPEASLSGSSYPLTITLGDVSQALSGQYRDIITIDVTPG